MSNLSRLKSQLLTSGLQKKDNPLFQVINQLIDAVTGNTDGLNINSNSITPTDVANQSFLTKNNNTATLPNSLRVIAGQGIQFQDSPGQRIISGGSPIFGLGDSGLDGNDGEIGPPGLTGVAGVRGLTGATGPFLWGQDGEDGNDGFPLPGTAGANGISGPAIPGFGYVASLTLNATQLVALTTTGVTLVAAAGPNTIIVPVMAMFKSVRATAFTGSTSQCIGWSGISNNLTTGTAFAWNSATVATLYTLSPILVFNGANADNASNVALVLKNAGAGSMTGGTGNSIQCIVQYYIASTP